MPKGLVFLACLITEPKALAADWLVPFCFILIHFDPFCWSCFRHRTALEVLDSEKLVVQSFLSKPLLIDGYKWDMRARNSDGKSEGRSEQVRTSQNKYDWIGLA